MIQVALPYPTLRSSLPLREEPYAGSRADLPWKPYLRRLLGEDNNHCTSGGAPLELWYWSVFVSLRDPFSVV